MNHLRLNILLATASIAPSGALIVAWLADRWLPNSWLMRASIVTIALVVAGICSSIIMARIARSQLAAYSYLERLCRVDDIALSSNSAPDSIGTVPDGPWGDVFGRLRDRLAQHGDQLRAAEMTRAAAEVRARRTAAELERMKAVLASLSDPVLALDEYNELVLANPSAEALFQFDLDATESRALAELIRCEELVSLLKDAPTRKAISQRSREVELVDGSGRRRWFSATARPIGESEEQSNDVPTPRGTIAVLKDISHQRDIQKRNAEFVSAASHEMKTPLSGIKAYVELLADGDAEDEKTREEFLGVINGQADRLTRLIDNLLNLARIEAGVVTVSKQSQSLNDLLTEALHVVQPAAEQKGVELIGDLSPMYLGVLADRDMLLQAAINLLSNAIKYTPSGRKVTLRSRLVGNDVQFEIEDQGVGLSKEDQQRVFEKFYRVKKDQNMAAGTGLGLPLAQHIVQDVHGGQLSVESELGVGSTFRVRLPSAGQMS